MKTSSMMKNSFGTQEDIFEESLFYRENQKKFFIETNQISQLCSNGLRRKKKLFKGMKHYK